MKKINLIFALLLSLMGVTSVLAQDSVTEGFEFATDGTTAISVNSDGMGLSNGWVVVGSGNYAGIATGTAKDLQLKSGSYVYAGTYSIGTQYSNSNTWLVCPVEVSGTLKFYARRYSTSRVLTIGLAQKSGDSFTITNSSLASYTSQLGTEYTEFSVELGDDPVYVAFKPSYAYFDNVTYTPYVQADGPAFAAYDGTSKLTSPYSYDFGLATAGTTKTFTLKNPGTADLSVSVSETGSFGATLSAATIAAGSEATLTVTMPETSGSSAVTITPDAESITPFIINVSGVVRDANKMFEDFSGKVLPADWTSTGSWNFDDGYAKTGNNTNLQLTTPVMVFEDGETFVFEAAGCSTWASYGASYQGKVIVQTSTDGTNFSDLQTFSGMGLDEWQSCSVTIPAGTKYVRFVASYASIDNVYGGELDQTPRPKLEVEGIANGGSLSWGYSDVPAGSTKTITLKNDGTADLDVTIAATDDYTVDPASATIEAGSSVVVTIGTPAHDGSGVLTITPAEESGLSPYTISLSSYYKEPKPVMSIDKTSIAFGKVNEVKNETITVSNTGDGELVATIENDNTTNFTVEPAEGLTVAPGETGTITVTYNYVEGTWGTFKANVKVTPNYGGTYDVKTITVSATSKNPNVWDEDFEEGAIPEGWLNEGAWQVSQPTASGNNGTYMAYISSYNNPKALTTPCLEAKAGEQLTFYIGMQYDDEPLTIEYSADDRATWSVIEENVENYTESGTITFTAPADGTYYLRFTGTYAMLDDFNGFKLFQKEHDALITGQNIPSTGNQYVEYKATVTVKEMVGKDENVMVEFYLGETKMGETEGTLDPNGEETFEVTFTPEEAFEGEAHFKVTFISDDDEVFATFNSDPVAVTIAAAPVLDETTGSLEGFENWASYPVVSMKYSLKAGWNTIILPFAWSDLSVFGDGAKVYAFSDYSDANGISFTAATSLNPQTPYVLYATEAKSEITFMGVTQFRNSTNAEDLQLSKSGATFQGTYAPVAAPDMEGKYGVVPSTGRIQKGSNTASLKGFRGYFTLPASAPANVVATFFDADGTVTAIKDIRVLDAENGDIFDLSGRKVTGKAKAGVYIQNGKKIVVK